jgi:hypothetical protein
LKFRGILTSVAAVAAVAAALAGPGTAWATTSGGPHAAFARNLHVESARAGGNTAVGPRAGIVPPLGTHIKVAAKRTGAGAGSCAEPNCDIGYGGGPVQHNPRIYVVFWGPGWLNDSTDEAAANYLVNLYYGLGASGDLWSLTTSQYSDGTGHPTFGSHELVEYGDDTSASPSEVTPSDLAAEAVLGANAFSITDVPDAQVVVVSQSGTCFSDGFAGSSCQPVQAAYCGWHSYTGFGSGELSFTNLPFQLDAGSSCGEDFINSGSAGEFDGFSIVGGHEYAESVTDPQPDSGYADLADNVSGGEIADKCAWAGELWGTPDPAGDVKLSTGTYAMQSLWSNATGSCVMSGVSVRPVANQTSALGHAVSLQVHASAVPFVTLTYSAVGLPAGLSINASTGLIHGTVTGPVKQYSPSVHVAFSTGTIAVRLKWTVDAVGKVTGTWSKCVDNANGKTTGGNKIDISSCTGKAQQTITFTPGGQLQVQGGCITGTSRAFFEPCTSATSKIWTRVGSEYVNKSNGKCLTDPNNSKVNGTALTLATCSNRSYQRWSLP